MHLESFEPMFYSTIFIEIKQSLVSSRNETPECRCVP